MPYDRHHFSDTMTTQSEETWTIYWKKKRKDSYSDIFSKCTLVLIEGRPRYGKTTLSQKITRDGARGPNILKGAEEIFLVSRILALKNINSLSGILNIIYHNEMSQKVASKLDNNDDEGACFVGWA